MAVPWEPSTLFQQPFPNQAENSWERQDSSLPTRNISLFAFSKCTHYTPSGVRLTKTWARQLADTTTEERTSSPEQHMSLSVPSQHRCSVPHLINLINLPCRTMHENSMMVFLWWNTQKTQRKHILNFFFWGGGSLLHYSLKPATYESQEEFLCWLCRKALIFGKPAEVCAIDQK